MVYSKELANLFVHLHCKHLLASKASCVDRKNRASCYKPFLIQKLMVKSRFSLSLFQMHAHKMFHFQQFSFEIFKYEPR